MNKNSGSRLYKSDAHVTYLSPASIVDVESEADETQREDAVRRRPRDDVVGVVHVRVVAGAQVDHVDEEGEDDADVGAAPHDQDGVDDEDVRD